MRRMQAEPPVMPDHGLIARLVAIVRRFATTRRVAIARHIAIASSG